MYPSWGNFGGGSGPHKQLGGGGQAPGFGGFEASPSGSRFSSLQEQHFQQMQQLQMLHQKQLQSVLHHGSYDNAYDAGHSGGYSGTPWHPEGPGHTDSGGHQQPPPPPTQPNEPQPVPPPPEPPSLKPPEKNGAPKEATKKQSEDDKSLPLQVMFSVCGVKLHHFNFINISAFFALPAARSYSLLTQVCSTERVALNSQYITR